ncbi:MAG: hypothetical protein ABI120_12750 [Gemmatimonadaceae bacterium]
MKGGKADKTRRTSANKPANARADAKKTKGGARPPNVAPPKGSRKRPDSGPMSTSGDD